MAIAIALRSSIETLSELTEDEAFTLFCHIRWAETCGAPVCPFCSHVGAYFLKKRRRFNCKRCAFQFSPTSGTVLSNRKMSYKNTLIALKFYFSKSWRNNASEMSRLLNVQHKSAWVLSKKLGLASKRSSICSTPDEWRGYWQRSREKMLKQNELPGRPWSAREDDLIQFLLSDGYSHADIASVIKRTGYAVQDRQTKLRKREACRP